MAEWFTKHLRCNSSFSPGSKPLYIAREVPLSKIRDTGVRRYRLNGDYVYGEWPTHCGAYIRNGMEGVCNLSTVCVYVRLYSWFAH